MTHTVKLAKMDDNTFNEMMDYAEQHNDRFFNIKFDIMHGVFFESPSINFAGWVKQKYGI